jgi:hypothetical protein
MTRRGRLVGVVLAVLTPAIAHSQGLEIDHKAVGCIVVGKYPKMNACFTPVASLARSRVYFRPEGTPSWYYVDMKSDQPCLSGTLPRPGKKLVGKKVEYYLEAQNKTFVPSRTAEYAPIVVRSAQECKKNVPVAPFVNNATVAVFPSVPAGFVGGGIGTAAVVGIVGAGAAVAGTTAVVVSNNNNDTTTTTIASSVNTTTTLATVTTTTPTTTLPKVNHAPNAVLKVTPDPPQGLGPLTVTFNMCASSDADGDPLSYFFTFGDGGTASGSCIETHTYAAGPFRDASAGGVRALDSSYNFEGSAVDPGGLSQTRTRTVVVTKATPPPPPACVAPPPPTITSPVDGACFSPGITSLAVSVTATDPQGISNVTVKAFHNGDTAFGSACAGTTGPEGSATATGGPPSYSATVSLTPPSSLAAKCMDLGAIVTNSCGLQSTSTKVTFYNANGCYPYPYFHDVRKALAWSSDLDVEGGRLQLVVNGSAVSYPGVGRAYGMAAFIDGQNHVEATLVEGRGKAGLWRFDFMSSQAIAPGSIRVLAGDVASVAASSITFHIKGIPGERIAFTFDKK